MAIENIIIPSTLALISSISGADIKQEKYQIPEYNAIKEISEKLSKKQIQQKVYAIVSDKLGVKIEELNENTNYTNDLGADSLDTVELIMEFEKEFGISIADEIIEKIETVGQSIDIVFYILNNGILLYSEENFKGKTILITGSFSPYSFQPNNIIENGLSSIIVPKKYRVVLYTQKDYKGDKIIINALKKKIKIKNFKNLKSTKHVNISNETINWNDKIISMKVEKLTK